jgi:hypothetical protein
MTEISDTQHLHAFTDTQLPDTTIPMYISSVPMFKWALF